MDERETLVLGGLTPFTTIDFPGRLAAVVFCQGCPWRCGYCHNPHLLTARTASQELSLSWGAVLTWLETRRGLLDGIVFSGGEPLLQRGLPHAALAVRDLGFAVALHTAGPYPQRLERILPLVDWVGFDIKAPFDAYPSVTGATGGKARESLAMLLSSGINHELRFTLAPALDSNAIIHLADELAELGVQRLVLQIYRKHGQPDPAPAAQLLAAVAERIPDIMVR